MFVVVSETSRKVSVVVVLLATKTKLRGTYVVPLPGPTTDMV